jgi:hypothetical protein
MVWPITGANLTSPETLKSMKRGKLAVAQEDCWRNIPITLIDPGQPILNCAWPVCDCKDVGNRTQFCCNRCGDMRYLRFATRLPFFLIAEAALWCAALFGRHLLFLNRESEALEQHRRLLDWLRGVPKEHKVVERY